MKQGVHARFLDQSTSVREAAVELVGRFILIRPDLIPTYYDMLSERILVSLHHLFLAHLHLSAKELLLYSQRRYMKNLQFFCSILSIILI